MLQQVTFIFMISNRICKNFLYSPQGSISALCHLTHYLERAFKILVTAEEAGLPVQDESVHLYSSSFGFFCQVASAASNLQLPW